MPSVETVNGPVDVEDLGLTLIHEHFCSIDEATKFQFPHLYDDAEEWESAISEARAVVGHGVKTVVDPGAMFLSRNAVFSKRVADESGLNVILATGVYTYDHLPQPLLNRDEDQIAEILVHDVEHGIQGTGHQARVHQVRGGRARGDPERREDPPRGGPRFDPDRPADHGPLAAGLGHRPGADEDLPRRGGGPSAGPDRPHRRHRRPGLHRAPAGHRLLDRPRPVRPRPLPAHRPRNATTLALLERGYVERMFLSQDFCPRSTGSRARFRST